jgi:RNA polymerase sigma factor (sigma-70 family)
MTTEEQNALHAKYKAGDIKARDALLAMCERDIKAMVRKVRAPKHLVEDMLQDARVAVLAKALPKFQPSQGLQFRFYAALWAREAIKRCVVTNASVVLSHKRGRQDLSLNAPVDAEEPEDEHIDHLDAGVDIETEAIRAQEARVLRMVMERVISRLKARENQAYDRKALCRAIVHNRLLSHDPATLDDVGRSVGASRETVRKTEVAILRLAHMFVLNAAEAA